MKAVFYNSAKKIFIKEIDPPVVEPDYVLIKTAFCAICDDDFSYTGRNFIASEDYDTPIGHEMSGVIECVGKIAAMQGFKAGDRVFVHSMGSCGHCSACLSGMPQHCTETHSLSNAMREYVSVHWRNVIKLPDDFPLEKACLLEPIACSMAVVEKAGNFSGLPVAVLGCGFFGQIIAQIARLHGAASIAALDFNPNWRSLATELGVDYTVDANLSNAENLLMQSTSGNGFPVVFEASNNTLDKQFAFRLLARGGHLVYHAQLAYDQEIRIPFFDFYFKDATISSSFLYPTQLGRVEHLSSLLTLDPFMQSIYSIDDIEEAFLCHSTGMAPKIIIRFP